MMIYFEDITMNNKTRQDAYKLALNFFKNHCEGTGEVEDMVDSLLRLSTSLRPAYWRRLRNAIALSLGSLDELEWSTTIQALMNPATCPEHAELNLEKKAKQKRRKSVSAEEHQQIVSYLQEKEDHAVMGAITIAHLTGCRPSEMPLIYFSEDHTSIIIQSTKKTDNHSRGLDRELFVDDEQLTKIQYSILAIRDEQRRSACDPEKAMSRIQHRLAICTKSLWPRRQYQITLYSYRHQMGSDLKGSGGGAAASVIMGHQSTRSIDRYGNRTKAQRTPEIRVSAASMDNVRIKSNSPTSNRPF
jgi:integrase